MCCLVVGGESEVIRTHDGQRKESRTCLKVTMAKASDPKGAVHIKKSFEPCNKGFDARRWFLICGNSVQISSMDQQYLERV